MSRPVSCATLRAAVTTAVITAVTTTVFIAVTTTVITAVTTVCSEISPKLRNDLIPEILGWI